MPKWPLTTKWPGGNDPASILTSVDLVEQWRADSGVTVATGVSLWSGRRAGTPATQGTGGNQPTYNATDALFNNAASISFDGVNDYLSVALNCPSPSVSPRWYWIIMRNAGMAAPSFVICGAGVASHIVYRQGGDTATQLSMFNTTKVNTCGNSTVGAARRVAVKFGNSTADYIKIGGTTVTGANAGDSSAASFAIGGDGTGANAAAIAIAEILVCAGEPTATEQSLLDSYAISRYGSAVVA